VDEVVEDAPYVTSVEYLDRYNCDFCVHGDDITTAADGTDCYAEVKEAGRYRECKRTQGVSTTELVGRMLLMTRTHHRRSFSTGSSALEQVSTEEIGRFRHDTNVSHFLPTSRRIVQFSEGRDPKPTDKVVYADGAFDLFHAGHVEFLRKAKECGDYLLVGVHDDQTINRIKGSNFPLMNLQERVLSVLACRYVDEVIIGAPYSVTKDVLSKVAPVAVVVHGVNSTERDMDGSDPYALPKSLGIYKEIEHNMSSISTSTVIERIIQQRQLYEERQRRKREKAMAELEMEKAGE
jgi:ethanolamine-phosphate cytidylyltransferase